VRQGVAAIQIKAGTAATTGTQTTPTADAGWTGIYVVTVANGAATITSGNITQLATAPFLLVTLPNVPAGVQGQSWTYWVDTGSANALAITPVPAIASYVAGQRFSVKAANANTGATTINVSGLGTKAVVSAANAALVGTEIISGGIIDVEYNGTSFQIVSETVNVTANSTKTGSAPKRNYFEMVSAGTQSVPSSTITAVTDMTLTGSLPSDAVFSAGGTITIGPLTAGVWTFDQLYEPSQNTAAATVVQAYLYKNGVIVQNQTVTGTFCTNSGTVRVANGDVLTMEVWQNSGHNQLNVGPGAPPASFLNLYQISS
jgi:hypothetical protein